MSISPNGEKLGRPTIFTQELADLICLRVATSTFGLKKLCDMHDDLPNHGTVYEWRYKYDTFSDQYTKAKMAQAELLAEEILDIADDATNDWMETIPDDERPIGWKLNGEHVNRSRLRIDTRKWHASKLAPKIYGVIPSKDSGALNSQSLVEKLIDKLPSK